MYMFVMINAHELAFNDMFDEIKNISYESYTKLGCGLRQRWSVRLVNLNKVRPVLVS